MATFTVDATATETATTFNTISGAISAAQSGDTIQVLAGTYNEDLTVDKTLTFLGANQGLAGNDETRGGETIITGPGISISGSATGVTFDGFTLSPQNAVNAIEVIGENFTVTNSVITAHTYQKASGLTYTNNKAGGISGQGDYSGNVIAADSSAELSGWTITGNEFHDFDRGIMMASSGTTYGDIDISNNSFDNFTGRAVQIGDDAVINDTITISGNTISNATGSGGGAIRFVGPVTLDDGVGVTIENNTLENLTFGFMMNNSPDAAGKVTFDQTSNTSTNVDTVAIYSPAPSAVDARLAFGDETLTFEDLTITFDDGAGTYTAEHDGASVTFFGGVETLSFGTEDVHIVGAGAFASIQAAVDAASASDTIFVAEGTYTENVTIPDTLTDLTIQGAFQGTAGSDAVRDLTGGAAESTLEGYMLIRADGVTVDGMRFETGDGPIAGFGGSSVGVGVQAENVEVTNSTFYRAGTPDGDLSRAVINALDGGGGMTVSNNAMTGWHTGTYVQGANNVTVSGNSFADNFVGMSADAYPGGDTNLQVTGNTFDNALEDMGVGAVGASWDTASDVSDNTFNTGFFDYDPATNGLLDGTNTFVPGAVQIEGSETVYTSIQAAVDAADANDTIMIGAGTFTEQVDLSNTSNLTILGAQSGVSAGVAGTRDKDSSAGETILTNGFTFGGGAPSIDGLTLDGLRLEGDALGAIRMEGGLTIRNTIVDHDKSSWGVTLVDGSSFGADPLTITIEDSSISGARGVNLDGAQVSSVTFDGNVWTTQDSAVGVTADVAPGAVTFQNNDVTGVGFYTLSGGHTVTGNSFDVAAEEYGIRIFESGNGTFTGNTFTGDGTGILLRAFGGGGFDTNDVSANTLTENAFGDPDDIGASFGGNIIDGTAYSTVEIGTSAAETFAGTGDGNYILAAGGDDTVTGASGDDLIDGGEGSDLAVFSGNIADYDVTVNVDGTISVTDNSAAALDGADTLNSIEALKFADGFFVAEGMSIQAAVDAATAGDTILVAAGAYDENVTIDKAVTLVGPNAGLTGHDAGRGAEASIEGNVVITADGATLSGFTLTKPAGSTSTNDINFSGWSGINLDVQGDNVTVTDTIVEAFGAGGGFDGSGFVQMRGAGTFDGNLVQAGAGYDAANDARGVSSLIINADTDDAVTVNNNHLLVSTNVTASPNDADGLFLFNAGEAVISNNLISGTDGGFVAFGNYGPLTLSNNTIENVADTGIRLFESMAATKPDVVLNGNTVTGDNAFFSQGAVKLGETPGGSGFPEALTNFEEIPSIFRANSLDGNFGVVVDGNLSLFTDQGDAIAAAGGTGAIWNFAAEDFQVFTGMSIQAAVDAAADGDTITVGAGTFTEDLSISTGVTINGANVGIAGTGARDAETVIDGQVSIGGAAAATLDGVTVLNDEPTGGRGALNALTVTSDAGHVITNSMFESTVAGGGTGGLHDVAIFTNVLGGGSLTITDNFFGGGGTLTDGDKYSSAAWGRGIYSNGGGVALEGMRPLSPL